MLEMVGGLEHVFFFAFGNFIIPTDELHHFSEIHLHCRVSVCPGSGAQRVDPYRAPSLSLWQSRRTATAFHVE